LLLASACATSQAVAPPSLRRGQPPLVIQGELSRILGTIGYQCKPTADGTQLECAHPDRVDLFFAYLLNNNNLQIYAAFGRSGDASLNDTWRGDCAAVLAEVNQVNAGYLPKLSCEGDALFFTFYTWLPDNGFTDQDIAAFVEFASGAVGDAITAAGMLKPEAAPAPVAPAGT